MKVWAGTCSCRNPQGRIVSTSFQLLVVTGNRALADASLLSVVIAWGQAPGCVCLHTRHL